MEKRYGTPVRERESVFINLDKRISTTPDVRSIYGDYSKLDYIPCRHREPTIYETIQKIRDALHARLLSGPKDDLDDCIAWVDLNKKEDKDE